MTTSAVATTNRVEPTPHSHVAVWGGITVNGDIPLSGVEPWRRTAIQKVISLGALPANWDARGSAAPCRAVRQAAIDFLMSVPNIGAPRIVPTSAGGYHFEWSVAERELEISLDSNCSFEALLVQNGMPMDEESAVDFPALFGWLISK